jgi:hypothetical protein
MKDSMNRRGAASAGMDFGMAAVVFIAVALASLAIVLALAAIRNAKGSASAAVDPKDVAHHQSLQQHARQEVPNWSVSGMHANRPINSVPAYPPTYPPVRTGERVLDVRVHNSTPGPPMHPFAIAAGEPFSQVGIVYSLEADARHPLFAREAPYRRNRYQYYVSTDNSSIQISARSKGRDCGEELGCDELYTDDKINVPELGDQEFTVKIHNR